MKNWREKIFAMTSRRKKIRRDEKLAEKNIRDDFTAKKNTTS
jgi:hypothetical protein